MHHTACYIAPASCMACLQAHLQTLKSTGCVGCALTTSGARSQIWGGLAMSDLLIRDSACWLQHMQLDPTTGLDPEGIQVRAAEGIQSLEWFAPKYHVWALLFRELRAMGYGPASVVSMLTTSCKFATEICDSPPDVVSRAATSIDAGSKVRDLRLWPWPFALQQLPTQAFRLTYAMLACCSLLPINGWRHICMMMTSCLPQPSSRTDKTTHIMTTGFCSLLLPTIGVWRLGTLRNVTITSRTCVSRLKDFTSPISRRCVLSSYHFQNWVGPRMLAASVQISLSWAIQQQT